jgi:hypothetical protein
VEAGRGDGVEVEEALSVIASAVITPLYVKNATTPMRMHVPSMTILILFFIYTEITAYI